MTGASLVGSGLRTAVDRMMSTLWAGGVNNPMDSIEQLSYLIFLRLLSRRDGALCCWDDVVTRTGDELSGALREAIGTIHLLPGLPGAGRLLFRDATLKIYDHATLRRAVALVDGLDLDGAAAHDLTGDMYEYLLGKLSASGTNGQFRTPRHIIDLVVALADPRPAMRICDPACGTAGFLLSASAHGASGELLTGFDNDATMVRIAALNLYLHRLEEAGIAHHNPLTTAVDARYDVILANPPFAGRVQRDAILPELDVGTRETELLFLRWLVDHLADGGTAGVIVPAGVLFGSSRASRAVRERLLSECDLRAVVTLPSGVFRPYSGVGTAILVLRKGRPTERIWFYELGADGYSLDDRRVPVEANDIPDVVARWPGRDAGPRSFTVPVEVIRGNGLVLLPAPYRPEEEDDDGEHESPQSILAEIAGLEARVARIVADLTHSIERTQG